MNFSIRSMPPSKLLRLILLACFLLRFGYLAVTGFHATLVGDGPAYMDAANFIARGIYPPQHPITRPPLYPLLISIFLGLGEDCPAAVRIVQVLLDTVGCFLLARICSEVFDEKVAVIAAAVYALNPYFIFDTVSLHTETLYQLLMIGAAFLFIRSLRVEKPAINQFSAGIMLGLSALTRPQSLLTILLLAAISAVRIRSVGIRTAGYILVGAVLTIAPWTLRNAIRYGEFIPVTEGAGFTFWLGNNRPLLEKFRTKEYSEFLKIDRRVFIQDSAELRKPIENASPRARDAFWFRLGKEAIRDLGREYPTLLAYKLGVYFRPTLSPQAYGLKLSLLLLIFPGPILILGFIVFVRSLFHDNASLTPILVFSLSCFLTGLALAILFQSQLRFRVPLLDPWLIVFGSWKIAGWFTGKDYSTFSRIESQ